MVRLTALHCTSLVITRGAHVKGIVAADRVVVDGNVDGPIQGGQVLQSRVAVDVSYGPKVERRKNRNRRRCPC
jgi:hypothetical protein